MTTTITKGTKCCATCANWGGDRCSKHGQYVETDFNGWGQCYAKVPGPTSKGHTPNSGRSCSKYQCWGALT